MSKLLETLDAEAEFKMRLELREVLRKTVALLATHPDTRKADELLILIEQTLEDTAP
jgi:hypothetical protein